MMHVYEIAIEGITRTIHMRVCALDRIKYEVTGGRLYTWMPLKMSYTELISRGLELHREIVKLRKIRAQLKYILNQNKDTWKQAA